MLRAIADPSTHPTDNDDLERAAERNIGVIICFSIRIAA
jgi:hypothetical protein